MSAIDFERLRDRTPQRFPRPLLFVGVGIAFFAYLLVKVFTTVPETVPSAVPAGPEAIAPQGGEADGGKPGSAAQAGDSAAGVEGILSIRGKGEKIIPPRLVTGERPEIPEEMLHTDGLTAPRIYVKVGREGQVSEVRLVTSSGSEAVDRIVLEGLGRCRFHPASSSGRPVQYSSVITYPLRRDPQGNSD